MFLHLSVCLRGEGLPQCMLGYHPPSPANKSVLFPYSNISEAFVKIKLSIPVHWTVFGQLQKDFNCEPVCQPVPEQFQGPHNEWKREIKRMCHSKTWPELGLVPLICLASTEERVSCTIENLDLNSIRHTGFEEALHTANKNITLLKYPAHLTSSSLRSTGINLRKYPRDVCQLPSSKGQMSPHEWAKINWIQNFGFTFLPKIAKEIWKTKLKMKQIGISAFLWITSDRMKKDQMKYEAGDQRRSEHTTATTATTTSTGFI